MKKTVLIALALFALITNAWQGDAKAEQPSEDIRLKDIWGKYAFQKQIYMNPLSSFLAIDGFQEYYTFSEKDFLITDQTGNQRSMKVSYQPESFDEAAFQNSFMMEGLGIPDVSAYKDRRQYTIMDTAGSLIYRLYLLDNTIWLVQIHKDSANRLKSEYIWSIYQIERFDGKIPLAVSVLGTQDSVNDFLAHQGDFHSGYEKDTCYNITPDSFLQAPDFMVFKYDQSCASFLLFKNEVFPLGEWFGGYGITSMAMADLNEDGIQELYFTYSFGSGLHRSQTAYFDPAKKQVTTLEYAHLNKDMIVAMNEKGGLSLYDATFSNMKSAVQYEMKSTGLITDIIFADGKICLKPVPQE